jgi:hypothetical protein
MYGKRKPQWGQFCPSTNGIKMAKVTAQTKDGEAQVDFEYEFGDSLEAACKLFGEGIVWNYALRGLTIAAQGYARGMMKSGKSLDEIRTAMTKWKPGEPRVVKTPQEKIAALLDKLSPEDRARLAQELKAKKAA